MWHGSCIWVICVTWPIHMCDRTYSYVWHDSFIHVTWLIHVCDISPSCVWHDSFICVTWLIQMCGMTHSYVWRDSSMCVTWLIHPCDMTHSYVWRDPFTCVTWLMQICIRYLCKSTEPRSFQISKIWMCDFPQKSPIISGSLAERDLQLKASLPPFRHISRFERV